VVKKIVLVLIVSLLLSCKGLKIVTFEKPMTNLELSRYIRLIENRRLMSIENYFYRYGFLPNYNRYYIPNNNFNYYNFNNYSTGVRSSNVRTNIPRPIPQTGTTGNTTNVQAPIPKVNIKTKQ
tara:strand:+ start:51 stop:419 length:369 start_codon:yes stop_codon:yes gene_type:complete